MVQDSAQVRVLHCVQIDLFHEIVQIIWVDVDARLILPVVVHLAKIYQRPAVCLRCLGLLFFAGFQLGLSFPERPFLAAAHLGRGSLEAFAYILGPLDLEVCPRDRGTYLTLRSDVVNHIIPDLNGRRLLGGRREPE